MKLISQKLPQTKERDHGVAVFDMWSHQDDPLRRTFLENLITQVQEFGWVNKEKWDQRIAELTRRRREDTTKVVPRLTGVGVVFAFTLLAIPVGSGLISAGARLLGSANASVILAALLLAIGTGAVLAPAIYYGFVVVIRRWTRKTRPGGREEDGILNDLPALLTRQASTESRTIVTQTPDPTSVEFESVFRDLLDEALQLENRKLLLVVDNLDRVQPLDALSIWSTLQTFLGYSDYRRPIGSTAFGFSFHMTVMPYFIFGIGWAATPATPLPQRWPYHSWTRRFSYGSDCHRSCSQIGARSSKRLSNKRSHITKKRISMTCTEPLLSRVDLRRRLPLLETSRSL